MQTITLKPGREKSLRRHHPWLFDGAIAKVSGESPNGLCVVRSASGEFLGAGVVSPEAALRARIVRFDGKPLDADWIGERVRAAIAYRRSFLPPETDAYRVIHAEGDLLPGIVADAYDGLLAVQSTTAGAEAILPWVADALRRELSPRTIVFRRDLPQREYERLSTANEISGEPVPPGGVTVRENGLRFALDPVSGQKTGFFLDQRDNRALVRSLASGRRMLNVFSFSGGFGVYAAAGGAVSTVNVDVSAPALELARRNYGENSLEAPEGAFVGADAFDWLREEIARGARYDLVVVDPPAFVKSKGALERGLRGYKDVNLQAMKLVAPGGLLLTCSCSGLVSLDLFQKVVFGAASDAGATFRLVRRCGAGADHPVLLDCPETEYLKGLLLERAA